MTTTSVQPLVGRRDRYHLAVDAFLYAALIFLVGIGVQELLWLLISGGDPGSDTLPPVWLELIGALAMPLAVIGGPLLAWRVHGHGFGWQELLAAVFGAVLGGALVVAAVAALVVLVRMLPSFYPRDEGPWELVAIVAVAVVVFLAQPVVEAVRDLAGRRQHAVRDSLRLGIVALGLVAVAMGVIAGGESAELGLFLVLPAAPAACGAVAMDLWHARRSHDGTGG